MFLAIDSPHWILFQSVWRIVPVLVDALTVNWKLALPCGHDAGTCKLGYSRPKVHGRAKKRMQPLTAHSLAAGGVDRYALIAPPPAKAAAVASTHCCFSSAVQVAANCSIESLTRSFMAFKSPSHCIYTRDDVRNDSCTRASRARARVQSECARVWRTHVEQRGRAMAEPPKRARVVEPKVCKSGECKWQRENCKPRALVHATTTIHTYLVKG
jgi:hypothetical protein